jgi:hypothetical protein
MLRRDGVNSFSKCARMNGNVGVAAALFNGGERRAAAKTETWFKVNGT